MSSIKETLGNFIISKSRFFDLPDGNEAIVKLLSAEPVTTNFKGKQVEAIRYHFEVEGKERVWDRTSRELAKQMSNFSEGDSIRIKRIGKGNQTKYDVKKVG
ncbi:MAG: hypothetical protein P9M02_02280 [Candidatus Susulua stagnicola]|nr:hypothetical protein [Candidatus Susulua stagnicola]